MKYNAKVLCSIFVLAIAFLFSSKEVKAYSYEDYGITNEGIILVDSFHTENPNTGVLYMYVEPTNNNLYTKDYYEFLCTEGEFPNGETSGPLIFSYRPENKKISASLENGDVWVWKLSLENGSYSFANGDNINNKYTFDSSYHILQYGDDSEVITLQDTGAFRLYVLNGSPEWVSSVSEEFKEWAIANELEWGVTPEIETKTISVEQDIEQPEDLPEKKEIILTPYEEKEPDPEKTYDIRKIIKCTGAVLILVFLGFFASKRKRI
jgi:hypothetical protein